MRSVLKLLVVISLFREQLIKYNCFPLYRLEECYKRQYLKKSRCAVRGPETNCSISRGQDKQQRAKRKHEVQC